jgi:signal transduction histidine kinase
MSSHRRRGLQQAHTVLLLRWVLIIATSYLVLFSRPLKDTPPGVGLFVAAYLGSNLLLTTLLRRVRKWPRLDLALVLFDTVAVCTGLALTANAAIDFFPVYFLVIFVGALSEQLRVVVGVAVLISVVHLATLSAFVDFSRLVDGGYILRIPFLFVVALFFGYLVQCVRGQQRAEKARARQRRRTEILSAVTHDLKSPLGVIQSLAGLLLEHDAGALNDQQTDLVRRIHASARRAIQLSVNLLEAARIDAGRLRLQRRPVNVQNIVTDAVALARTASYLKRVTLHVCADPGLPIMVLDAVQAERAVSNLIDNAIKYTPAGGTVNVSARYTLGQLVLEVRDDGPGIPASEIPRLFEKYRRGIESGWIEGSGLGLFIVKAVAEAHGGTVELESGPGRGTAVILRLPSAPPEIQPVRHTSAAAPGQGVWQVSGATAVGAS